jgi:hypothetical protein
MDAVRLSLAPGDDGPVSSTRSRIEFEPHSKLTEATASGISARSLRTATAYVLPCPKFSSPQNNAGDELIKFSLLERIRRSTSSIKPEKRPRVDV